MYSKSPTPTSIIVTLRRPPSGGPWLLTYSPKGGIKGGTKRVYTAPKEAPQEPPPSSSQAQTPSVKARRAQTRRLKSLSDLLFSLAEPPTFEAFLYFDYARYKWWAVDDEEYTPDLGGSPTRWELRPRGKSTLNKVLQRFRTALDRGFPAGWYVYRWRIKSGPIGMPVLFIHLLGAPGADYSFEAARDAIRAAWLRTSESDNPDMAFIQPAHEASVGNITARHSAAFAHDLNILLDGRYEWGKIHRANMKQKPAERTLPIPAEVWQQVEDLLRRHHYEYCEAQGKEESTPYLSMLAASYGRAVVNPAIQPELMALLAPYMREAASL